MKRVLKLTLMSLMALMCVVLPMKAVAATVASGSCGDNLTWVLDDGGTLTISGTGVMEDYSSNPTSQPWSSYRSSIKSIYIHSGVESIGAYAFSECETLTTMVLGDTLSTIGAYAFNLCSNLKTVDMPDAVSKMGHHAFYDCRNLKTIQLSENLTKIPQSAFGYCKALESVTIPDSVLSIEENAFNATSALKEIQLSNNLRTICTRAFQSSGLSSVEIPQSVEIIQELAFVYSAMSKITFTGAAPSFSDDALAFLTATVRYPVNDSSWTADVMQQYGGTIRWETYINTVASGSCGTDLNWLLDGTGKLTVSGSGHMNSYYEFDMEDNVAPWGIYKDKILTVEIGDGVSSIGSHAFFNCDQIIFVEIGENVYSIGDSAFSDCTSLQSVSIPDGSICSISPRAFENCVSLESITLPTGKYEYDIQHYTFLNCTGLKNITFGENVRGIRESSFQGCSSLESIAFPKNITGIAASAFKDCTSLWDIQFLHGHEDPIGIDPHAFVGMTSNVYLTLPDSACIVCDCHAVSEESPVAESCIAGFFVEDSHKFYQDVGEILFSKDCSELICYPSGRNASYYTIPDNTRIIRENAFIGETDLTRITIPVSVTTIDSAFEGCCKLENITFEGNAPQISDRAFVGVTATIHYPVQDSTWDHSVVSHNYGGTLTWWMPNGSLNGYCGENAQWRFDENSETLIISGSGSISDVHPMYDYYGSLICMDSPWKAIANQIQTVIVGSDITYVGASVFAECANLELIKFKGDAPKFAADIFSCEKHGANASIYVSYPAYCDGWTQNVMQQYGGNITWTTEGGEIVEENNIMRLTMDKNKTHCLVGSTVPIIVTISPWNAERELVYSVHDNSILVSDDQHGISELSRDFKCLKEGVSTVTVTDKYTGKSVTQEITVVAPTVVTSLPFEDTIDVPVGDYRKFYSFTPSETGIYTVSRELDMSLRGFSIWFTGGVIGYAATEKLLILEAGTEYQFEVGFYECDGTETDAFRIEKNTEIENRNLVLLDESLVISPLAKGCDAMVYYTGTKTLKWTSSDPSVAEFEFILDGRAHFSVKRAGTTTITVTDGVYSDSLIITSAEPPSLQLDTPLPANTADSGMYVFTAPKQGKYVFTMDSGTERLKSRLETVYPADLTYTFTETTSTISKTMEAGETYWFIVSGTDDIAVDQNVTLTVTKASNTNGAVMQIYPTHHRQFEYLMLRSGFTPVDYSENVVNWEISDKHILGECEETLRNGGKAYDIYSTGEVTVTATSESGMTASCTLLVGTCGKNARWFIKDGTLTIFGSGKVDDFGRLGEYDRQAPLAPWQPYSESINTIIVAEGITGLGRCTFIDCINVTSIILPDTLRTIGAGAINSCTSLTDIVIPDSVTEIGVYAFTGCESLTNITLPKKITHISESMFNYCNSLNSITIPANVTSIGELAFSICENLEEIYFEGDAPAFASAVFMDVDATAYYPANNDSWTESIMQDYEGNIKWKAYCPDNHAEVVDYAVSPTCTETGLTEGKHCSACGKILVEQKSVPAVGHSYGKPIFTWGDNYSCTAVFACKNCSDRHTVACTITSITGGNPVQTVYTAKAVLNGHSYTDTKTITASPPEHTTHTAGSQWFSDNNSHWKQCTGCEEKMNIAAHIPGKEATENTSQKCSICGYVLQTPMGLDWFFERQEKPDNYLWASGYYAKIMEQYG